MTNKERFIWIAKSYIKREGIDQLLANLEKTDFFTAPASTKYHGSYQGGLVEHSVDVFDQLENDPTSVGISMESKAIVSLFHDICKANYYKVDYRNNKNEKGLWEKVPYYTVDDKYPLGHGEKSVMLVMDCMKLTPDEALAIRWHMGGFEPKENYNYLSEAYNQSRLALLLHLADMKATYLLHREAK